MQKTFQLETLTCPSCAAKIEKALNRTKGVNKAEVLFNSSRVKVDLDESVTDVETIKITIEQLGYEVLSVK